MKYDTIYTYIDVLQKSLYNEHLLENNLYLLKFIQKFFPILEYK